MAQKIPAKEPSPVVGRLNERGHEVLDSQPMAIPAHFRRPESLADQIRRMVVAVHADVSRHGEVDSFEDADDFDIPDDPVDPLTPYEQDFQVSEEMANNRAKVKELREELEGFVKVASRRKKPVQEPLPMGAGPGPDRGGKGGGAPPPQQ